MCHPKATSTVSGGHISQCFHLAWIQIPPTENRCDSSPRDLNLPTEQSSDRYRSGHFYYKLPPGEEERGSLEDGIVIHLDHFVEVLPGVEEGVVTSSDGPEAVGDGIDVLKGDGLASLQGGRHPGGT